MLDSLFVRVKGQQKISGSGGGQGRVLSTDSGSSNVLRPPGGMAGSVGLDFSLGLDVPLATSPAAAAWERGLSVGSDSLSVTGGGTMSITSSPFGRPTSQRVNSSRYWISLCDSLTVSWPPSALNAVES